MKRRTSHARFEILFPRSRQFFSGLTSSFSNFVPTSCAQALLAVILLTGSSGWAQEAFQMRELKASRVTVMPGGYFPRLEVLANGELLSSATAGAAHMGKTGRVDLARSPDGGLTWSDPVTVFDLPDRDDSMNLLVQLADGTLVAGIVSYTWDDGQGHGLGWEADIYVICSRDQGRTWSDPRRIDVVPLDWIYPFGRPVGTGGRHLTLVGLRGIPTPERKQEEQIKAGTYLLCGSLPRSGTNVG